MSGISGFGAYNAYSGYGAYAGGYNNAVSPNASVGGVSSENNVSAGELKSLKRSGQVECATCASRKYQDGSDEANVSFKSAAHIDPSSSGAKVMSHEQEHVNNAYRKASNKGGQVVSASVSLKTAICPECGRSYVAGGLTTTAIKYPKTSYGQNQKSADYAAVAGQNVNYKV